MRLSARASSELTSSILLRICLSFQGSALPAVWIGRSHGSSNHNTSQRSGAKTNLVCSTCFIRSFHSGGLWCVKGATLPLTPRRSTGATRSTTLRTKPHYALRRSSAVIDLVAFANDIIRTETSGSPLPDRSLRCARKLQGCELCPTISLRGTMLNCLVHAYRGTHACYHSL